MKKVNVFVSTHAKKRLSKRLNIPVKAHKKQACRAFKEGDIKCPLHNNQAMLIEYKGYYYVFGLDKKKKQPVLVTVFRQGENR